MGVWWGSCILRLNYLQFRKGPLKLNETPAVLSISQSNYVRHEGLFFLPLVNQGRRFSESTFGVSWKCQFRTSAIFSSTIGNFLLLFNHFTFWDFYIKFIWIWYQGFILLDKYRYFYLGNSMDFQMFSFGQNHLKNLTWIHTCFQSIKKNTFSWRKDSPEIPPVLSNTGKARKLRTCEMKHLSPKLRAIMSFLHSFINCFSWWNPTFSSV